MLNFIFFTVSIFIILKILVTKNSEFVLKVNPYIQTLVAFPFVFIIVLMIPFNFGIGLFVYIVTMYLGLVFQEYYQKFSFNKGETC